MSRVEERVSLDEEEELRRRRPAVVGVVGSQSFLGHPLKQ